MGQAPARHPSFEESLSAINLAGARLGYVLSALLMPAGVMLDIAVVPEHAKSFLVIRLAAGALAIACLALTYVRGAAAHPVLLGAGPPLICASAIELLIVRLSGAVSPYYAGLNLCILAVAVLYTWRWQQAALVSCAILGLWLVPALPDVLARRLEFAPFFSNLYFLSLTSVIAVASAVIRYRSAEREYAARRGLAETSAELSATLERVQELDRLKNEFFANVSHELRTPLTLILTPIEDLLTRQFAEGTRDALLVIRRNAYRLLRLIDDLLDLARLDGGGLRLHVAELDLVEIAQRVADAARPAAEVRGISLLVEAQEPELPAFGDPHRLEIVLTNLVGNALKFSPDRARISVRVWSDGAHVGIDVSDDGPGIAESELGRIFDRFYQVEGSERRRQGGAGIGLALAKKLVELHGGDLSVKSQLGVGSTFRVSLPRGREHFPDAVLERRRVKVEDHPGRRSNDRPLELPSEGFVAPPPPELESEPLRMDRGRRPRILLAEDERDLREYIETILKPHFDVTSVSDGAAALTRLKAGRVDLVLTDLMMPGTSGTDLCRKLKLDPSLRSLPVIVLTALSSTDNVLDAYSAGADDFVTKPFHSRVLVARINAQLKLRALGFQIADQARLATAGMLAGGVAHEVKNPLNAIANAARLLPNAKTRPELEGKLLGIIVEGARRIEDIVNSLEDHVHPAEGAQALPCDVKSGLESSLRLLEHKMNGVAVHAQYGNTRPVLALARELNHVFLNLLDNAVRAGSSNIWIQLEDADSHVRLSIADDGPGITPEAAELIFEPFYTTRAIGQGMGLGLYLSRRIVEGCGGRLQYRPRDVGGAEFLVELPSGEARA
ncbi:MAG TPA: ATP-binding protein [Polyangiaceae bacterium]|jgi:signal transduction histidine kinase|nr:ATP-binding protein [Polyangiaceae bacterium]